MPVPCLFHTYASGFAKPGVPSSAPPSATNSEARPPWQWRLLAERDELERRLKALRHFMEASPAQYATLPYTDRQLLAMQSSHMANYLSVLNARIQRLEPPVAP